MSSMFQIVASILDVESETQNSRVGATGTGCDLGFCSKSCSRIHGIKQSLLEFVWPNSAVDLQLSLDFGPTSLDIGVPILLVSLFSLSVMNYIYCPLY